MRWKAFAQTVEVDRAFKALLASPGGTLLKEAGLHRSLQAKLDHFNYASIDDLAADCRAAAEGHARVLAPAPDRGRGDVGREQRGAEGVALRVRFHPVHALRQSFKWARRRVDGVLRRVRREGQP